MLPANDVPSDRINRRSDALLATIAAAATVCFAWAGFQSAEWVRERFQQSDDATALSGQALEVRAEADRLEGRDVVLYVEWQLARRSGDVPTAEGIFGLFRPEVQALVAGGMAEDDGLGATDPFGSPDYDANQQRAEASRLAAEARLLSVESGNSSRNAARYGGLGLLFASVLAVAGISSRFPSGRTRHALLGFATVLLLLGFVGLIASPVAWIPRV